MFGNRRSNLIVLSFGKILRSVFDSPLLVSHYPLLLKYRKEGEEEGSGNKSRHGGEEV